MPRNGSGTYVLPVGQPVVPATTVSSSVFNSLVADLSTEVTRSLSTDGQTPMAADLSMGGNRLTNLAPATQPNDAMRLDQLTLFSGSDLIGFLQAGIGTIRQSVQTALRERVSVTQFGAVVGGELSVAMQLAANSLNGGTGTIVVPKGNWIVTGKVSLKAGQNVVSEGAVLDVSGYNGVFLSYNEADTFNFTMFHPPTLVQGFKVMGKVAQDAANHNFIFIKINRMPLVSVRDVTTYYAALAWVLDESILCTFDSVRCYNPISDCIAFSLTDAVNRFAPNGCSIVNSWFEEQKYPCTGINISAGTVNIDNCYLESLSILIRVSGTASAQISQTGLGLRFQAGSTAIQIENGAGRVGVNNCDLTFAGGLNATTMIGLNINSDVELTFNGNRISGIFGGSEIATVFSIKGLVTGTIDGNVFEQKGSGTTMTMFGLGDLVGAQYAGAFNGNHVEAKAGTTLAFAPTTSSAGSIQPHIIGNKFIRVSSFRQLSNGIIQDNTFDGAADIISWLGRPGGIVRMNRFYNPGWVLQSILDETDNFGLYDSNAASAPYVSAYLTANTQIPNNTSTRVAFGSEEYDTNQSYDPSTGRFQPRVPGVYHVKSLLAWYPSTVGVTQQYIYKNGTSYCAGMNNGGNTNGLGQLVDGYVSMNGTTDYIEIWVLQTSGANLQLASGQLTGSHLQIMFVRSLPR